MLTKTIIAIIFLTSLSKRYIFSSEINENEMIKIIVRHEISVGGYISFAFAAFDRGYDNNGKIASTSKYFETLKFLSESDRYGYLKLYIKDQAPIIMKSILAVNLNNIEIAKTFGKFMESKNNEDLTKLNLLKEKQQKLMEVMLDQAKIYPD